MSNFQEIADQLKGSEGGLEVANGKEMGEKMAWLGEHPEEYKKKGESAYLVVLNNRGAVKRNLERIARWADPIS
jgi:3-deoxy-D-manno-octulosonic-acid transferase